MPRPAGDICDRLSVYIVMLACFSPLSGFYVDAAAAAGFALLCFFKLESSSGLRSRFFKTPRFCKSKTNLLSSASSYFFV